MDINAVSLLNNISLQNSKSANKTDVDFSQYIKNALDKVNSKYLEADELTNSLVTGDAEDIHTVVLATEEAKLSLQLATEIRNKFVDAYKELMNVQV